MKTMKNHEKEVEVEVEFRQLGKVIIFRDRQTNKQNLPIIYRSMAYKVIVVRPLSQNVVALCKKSDAAIYILQFAENLLAFGMMWEKEK